MAMAGTKRAPDPKRQIQGAVSKAQGAAFEKRISQAFAYYESNGMACIRKTPESMKPIKRLEGGRFVACYDKKAQPDYQGVIRGGRAVMFEAKFTASGKMDQSRVIPAQAEMLDSYESLGARCYVLVGFSSGRVYRIGWLEWKSMKENYGRKYVTEADLKSDLVPISEEGHLLVLK